MQQTTSTITTAQYVAAIEALGLDPQLTASITISGNWVNYTEIVTDENGRPVLELGALVTRQVSGAILPDAEVQA